MTRYEMTDAERRWVEDRMGDCFDYRGEEVMLVATNGRWAVIENANGETGRVEIAELMKEEGR